MPTMWRTLLLAAALGLLPIGAAAQQLEATPRPAGEAKPPRYLGTDQVDFARILAAPPAAGSAWDDADVALSRRLQRVSAARYASAVLDDGQLYARFDEAYGRPIRRETQPALVGLLNRTIRDISAVTFAAKARFQRPRPYQRFRMARVCGEAKPPEPERNPTMGSSYPSGHSAYGWATAMVLSRVSPGRTGAVMARAADYAESRVICGVHFPSDVAAGQMVAAAVLARLDGDPAFLADLDRARAEAAGR